MSSREPRPSRLREHRRHDPGHADATLWQAAGLRAIHRPPARADPCADQDDRHLHRGADPGGRLARRPCSSRSCSTTLSVCPSSCGRFIFFVGLVVAARRSRSGRSCFRWSSRVNGLYAAKTIEDDRPRVQEQPGQLPDLAALIETRCPRRCWRLSRPGRSTT